MLQKYGMHFLRPLLCIVSPCFYKALTVTICHTLSSCSKHHLATELDRPPTLILLICHLVHLPHYWMGKKLNSQFIDRRCITADHSKTCISKHIIEILLYGQVVIYLINIENKISEYNSNFKKSISI